MITGKNYIGTRQSSKSGITYKTFNPELNTENPWVFHEASSDEIEEAVQLASQAFEGYRNISGKKKSEFLNAIADEMEALGDELLETYMQESGLPRGRAEGERGRTLFQLRSFAELVAEGSWIEASIDTGIPDRKPAPKPDLRKMLIPIGPVVVFGSSNFPFAYSTAGGDTASALAAGCPVIVKSHPMHSGTGELVASAVIKAAQKTGMPDGVFSNLNSSGVEVGAKLVQHPGVKAVGFTGSIKGGRALFDLAAKREEPIPVFAEMGSVNPVVALPSALKEKSDFWAQQYAGSITLGTGQFCTSPGLIIGIKGNNLTEFTQALGEKIMAIDPSCMLHPNIHGAFNNLKEEVSGQPEVNVVAAYEKEVKANYAQQKIITVEGKTFLENSTLHKEVFGPFSVVIQCRDSKELVAIIKKLEGQLTGTILGEEAEIREHGDIVEALQNRVGRIIFNGVPTGVEVCPSMQHGGPYPASTDSRFTAVGIHSIKRWVRPFSYQDWPDALLPGELKNDNPLGISRLVNGEKTRTEL
ncbi:aldehyde dehydrogenase (NADP(+)) [Sinomicrobium weinanense]|uniref:Aldehyde dehydrogenase (NADP(+)) n=1 Tax=Sinomicrobium weinanense TaxID=2842200 RepID=A0A926Q2I0_9FLAO|nr:aldehyde dehydrogenase (NADP(+)) [Sinomicrobium weinanense]MBC9794951.1 aldehyde dehydrogenase (NADP(+)) [Sinomicrobium weinanense]MBU3125188.1 aldehyde dehydrogenase (NADP(+)) [Sinomicrobium weinanense]